MRDTDAGPPASGTPNPIVASVDGRPIRLSDLGAALKALPENLRALPFDTLYPVLVDRLVDHQALVILAKRAGLEDNPDVRKEIEAAAERVLEGAYLSRVATPKVTDEAVRALYNRKYANRPATDEVRARHILVSSEAEARQVLEELRQGADFATLAAKVSKDPDGRKGGDLGFFRREQVWPAFADLAFSLQPGQIAANPVQNEYGWHVVKVEERRQVAPPGFAEAEASLRQELLAQAVQQAVEKARSEVIIRRYNLDGSELETVPRFRSSLGGDAPPLPAQALPIQLPTPAPPPR
jgi:peptidyl-prolyl cis-trans isomerase C